MPDDPDGASPELAGNRALWSLLNHLHTDAAAGAAWRRTDVRWGLFEIPESQLGALPPLEGRTVVELGAGTAFFSAALARNGARAIAIDLNEDQLATAIRCRREEGLDVRLLQADAQAVPLRDGCADVVVSEHGASVWCAPDRWVAEAARILKPGGHLAFLVNSVLSTLCVGPSGPAREQLQRSYAELGRMVFDGVEYHPSHAEWIRVLGSHGFTVVQLHELTAPSHAVDPEFYEIADARWSQRWPAEDLWVAQKV